VGGATVTYATLHNEDELQRKDVRVGDKVIVRRAGDVIPEVVGPVVSVRTGAEKPWEMPPKCPFCGHAIVRPPGEKVARCTGGFECPSRVREWLFHFASRGAWGEVSVGNLMKGIEAARHRPLQRLLVALGIRHVGATVARVLARRFQSLPRVMAASAEELASVEGLGQVIGQSVRAWSTDPDNIALVKKLASAGVDMSDDEQDTGGASDPKKRWHWWRVPIRGRAK
jgi:DNA ligase (NAD+)